MTALALTVQKLLPRLKFKIKVKFQDQGDKIKTVGIHGKVLSQKYSCEISIKA